MDTIKNGEVSFWYADMGGLPSHRARLPGNAAVDICVVGAGFTGLWTAYYLKKADPRLDIAIVEKEFAGFGASGRNGGFLSGGFSWPREKYAENYSRQDVIRLEAAMRGTVDEVIQVAAKEKFEADILSTDYLTVATNPAQMERLRERYRTSLEWDVPTGRIALIGREEALARIRIKDTAGAFITHGVARLQPAKLVRGLAEAVERLGVRIYEQTAAVRLEKGLVVTDRGNVRTPVIVRATEGFTAKIPGFSRSWLPMNSALIVTEPLPRGLWDDIGWHGHELLGDASHSYCYAQRTREGRIAMGGRGVPYRFGSRTDVNGHTQSATIKQLSDILTRLLPQTKDLRIDHAWCGVLGVPRDWCATVGFERATGMGWAGGYVGTGVSTSNLAGRTLADLILGHDTELVRLPWVNRSVRQWEPEPLRWLGIHAMYRLYHLADRREARGLARASRLATLANRLTGR